MAKKTTKSKLPTKLYACCRKAECEKFQEMVNFLKVWGLDHTPKQDGKRWYFDVAIPSHWNDYRIERFSDGLKKQPTGH